MILQYLHVLVADECLVDLDQMPTASVAVADAAPEHDAHFALTMGGENAWQGEFLGFISPHYSPAITFEQCNSEFIRKDHVSPVIVNSPSVHTSSPAHPVGPGPDSRHGLPFGDTAS